MKNVPANSTNAGHSASEPREMTEDELIEEVECKMTAPLYDTDHAVRFAHDETNVDPEVILTVLCSRDHYLLRLGSIPDDPDMGTTAAELRAAHPDLFPVSNIAECYIAIPLERTFIERDTGVGAGIVNAVMDADEGNLRQQGIRSKRFRSGRGVGRMLGGTSGRRPPRSPGRNRVEHHQRHHRRHRRREVRVTSKSAGDTSESRAPESLWTAAEVASFLRVSRSWVYHRSESGELPCLRIGALVRFDPGEIRAFARGERPAPAKVIPLRSPQR